MSESNVSRIEPHVEEVVFPFEPYEDICVIEQSQEEASPGGIVLVGKSKDFQSGRVVAVGPGRVYSNFLDASGQHRIGHYVPNHVKVGDYVVYGKFLTGEPILIAGKKYLMSRAGDLAGRSTDGTPLKIRLADPVE